MDASAFTRRDLSGFSPLRGPGPSNAAATLEAFMGDSTEESRTVCAEKQIDNVIDAGRQALATDFDRLAFSVLGKEELERASAPRLCCTTLARHALWAVFMGTTEQNVSWQKAS
jgi:hypothetical protein